MREESCVDLRVGPMAVPMVEPPPPMVEPPPLPVESFKADELAAGLT